MEALGLRDFVGLGMILLQLVTLGWTMSFGKLRTEMREQYLQLEKAMDELKAQQARNDEAARHSVSNLHDRLENQFVTRMECQAHRQTYMLMRPNNSGGSNGSMN